jgi:hypothetical protein
MIDLDGLSQTPSPTLIRPQRSLGGVVFDVTIEEKHEDSLIITEHPVEKGAPISDHAYAKPKTVTIRGGVSDSGASLATSATSGEGRSVKLYDQLRTLQASREPFAIVTGLRSYKNMMIETLSVPVDATTGSALILTADCREVLIVETKSTSMPPRSKHADGAKTGGVADKGDKQLQNDKRSAISEAAGGTGHRRPGGPA